MDEKQLAKLVKKTVAKASKPKQPPRRRRTTPRSTPRAGRGPQKDDEARELFAQMKKREF